VSRGTLPRTGAYCRQRAPTLCCSETPLPGACHHHAALRALHAPRSDVGMTAGDRLAMTFVTRRGKW